MARTGVAPSRRYGILVAGCLILLVQAGASRMLDIDERNIGIPGLHSLPEQIGTWKASGDQHMDPATAAYLRPDEYILRDYVGEQNGKPINLFIAYFKSLQNTYGPHSPRICLPGAGWLVSSSRIVNIPVGGRADGIPVNVYTMEKSNDRLLVLYWYQNDRDVWAQEYHAKLRLLPDLFRYRRSDVSLVRLITQASSSGAASEQAECLQFTQRLFPLLSERFASVH
jgi:EpsI family protein